MWVCSRTDLAEGPARGSRSREPRPPLFVSYIGGGGRMDLAEQLAEDAAVLSNRARGSEMADEALEWAQAAEALTHAAVAAAGVSEGLGE
jgi:hypothetical protein